MQRETKLFVLSTAAVLMPFCCSTLAVVLTHGVSFGNRTLDFAAGVVTIVSGLPFVGVLSISSWRKVIFCAFVVLLGLICAFLWSLWLSCAAYGSCV